MQTKQNEATRELKEYMDGFETISKFHYFSGINYMFPVHINDVQFFKNDIINIIKDNDIDDDSVNFSSRVNQHSNLSNPIWVFRIIPLRRSGNNTYYNMFDIDIRGTNNIELSQNFETVISKLQDEERHEEESRKIMEELIDAMYQLKVLGYHWRY